MLRTFAASLLLAATLVPHAHAFADEGSIRKGISELRNTPEAERGAKTGELAHQIAALPAGKPKVGLALSLAHLSTEGDPGRANLQAVTDALAGALIETPSPASKVGALSEPYVELAQLVRYEGMTVPPAIASTEDYKRADAKLSADDADVAKADFTLSDMKGKKWTLTELRGKIVMVNFWATWCPPCRVELPNLDAIAQHFAPQGLVILALTDEDGFKVSSALHTQTHFTVLLDPDHKAAKQFHVNGIPKTFVFNREGELVATAVDGRTQRQFMEMLRKAGLKPQG
jgi:thiol-disulfide isomerase/thioredoxin